MKRFLIYLSIGFFIFSIGANCYAGGSFKISWGGGDHQDDGHYHKKKGGPPPHAPAHGYRAKYKYRYYPDSRVYHCAEKGVYFWLRGDDWEVGASLPLNLQNSLTNYVSLELDTEKPYVHHAEHARNYPVKKLKKKHKKKHKKL